MFQPIDYQISREVPLVKNTLYNNQASVTFLKPGAPGRRVFLHFVAGSG